MTSKKTSDTRKSMPRAARATGKTVARASGAAERRGMRYVIPAAAVATIGTGLAAGGFLMKKQIAGFIQATTRAAIADASAIARRVRVDSLLELTGLQRRRGAWATVLPGLGVLAAGAVVGSAVAWWVSSARISRTAFQSSVGHGAHSPSNSAGESVEASGHTAA
ncbi:MAG TPA: hypothetical protein VIF09_13120 [Polyangiaceae bacterium]|jgi:hypothetical protein